MRTLDPEEAALWARVTATIRPLSREPVKRFPPLPVEPPSPPAPMPPRPKGPSPRQAVAATPVRQGFGTTLDGSWDKRLARGSVEPDRILDLHGHDLDGAWSAIDQALDRAIAAGERVVLLITGHARPGAPPIVRGRIRAAVHDWLAHSRHARQIAAVRVAHSRHGGGGSLYLILRRAR